MSIEGERERHGEMKKETERLKKEKHMDKAAYASLEDVSRLVRDMGDGEVIRIIFEEADNGEGRDC